VSGGGTIRTALACAFLVLLQYTVRPLLAWHAPIDFLVIALLYGAVRMRAGWAALFGFAIGLASDSLLLDAFGASALAMTVIGFSASWLKAVFFADNLALSAFFLFLGKWLFDLIFLAAQHRMGVGAILGQLLSWSLLSAAATAAAGVVLITVLRPLVEGRAT
jgi:rod shape-determining protein MreD